MKCQNNCFAPIAYAEENVLGAPAADNNMAPLVTMRRPAGHPHVAVFVLNRPKAKNAVNGEVSMTLEKLLEEFEADDELWIGIVASALKRVFCAGADLKAISKREVISTEKGGFAGIVKYPRTKPLIAAVDGAALAGGCEIVLACDLVVASHSATFGVPEVKRSLVPAAGGLFRLPFKLPHALAMEMILTGDPISADKAHRYGLVNEVVLPGEALHGALRLADRICENAPLAVRESKFLIDKTRFADDEQGFALSTEGMVRLFKTEDFAEGPRAFIEKRKPKWTGRSKL